MAGLAVGLAFLTGFGLGFAAIVVWSGLAVVLSLRNLSSLPLLAVVLGAALLGALYADHSFSKRIDSIQAGAFEGEIRVVNGPYLTQSGQRFVAEINSEPGSRICVYAGSAPPVNTGDLVLAFGRTTLLEDLSEIGAAAANARNCDAQLRLESMSIQEKGRGALAKLSRVRVDLARFLLRSAPGDAGALLSGLVTGDDGALSSDADAAFLSSGTSHITAISGANLTTIVLLIGVLASGAMRRSLGFVAATTVVIWLYVVMVGMQPSAFRAALLATAVLLGRWLGRTPDLLTLTVLLAALQVAVRPNDFETLGFRLSLAATIALIVVFDGRERSGQRSWMASLALAVVAAQLATLPILAMHVGEVSLTGALANLFIGPLATITFPLAFLGAVVGQIFPMLGDALLAPAIVLSRTMLDIVLWSSDSLPGRAQLGPPTTGAMVVLTLSTWSAVFWMSGDLRRFARHARQVVGSW